MQKYDSIIIGSGIAGMTASLYLKRENKNVLLIEKEMPGGQMVKTPSIENYPGFIKIEGSTLALSIYEQITNLEIPTIFEEVIEIKEIEKGYVVKTKQNTYSTKTVLIATGREPRLLGLKKEKQLQGKGISYCATCDGAFFKGKEVAVVGGGSTAVTEALFLSEICKKVYVLYRKENLRSEDILKERLLQKENVEVLYNTNITELKEKEGKLKSIIINNEKEINIEGLFIFIGYEPKNKFLQNILSLDIDNYIIVNEKMETSKKGIYACGDSIKKDIYQLTTAASEGTIAACEIRKYLLEE